MRFIAIAVFAILIPLSAQSKRGGLELDSATQTARSAADRLAKNPPPEEAARLQKEKSAAVEKIEGIANAEPKDAETQLEVGKSLASVEEAPRAIPYAERGLRLAQASGDKKLVREALLTGSEVFYKAGDYALARERAQRILKDDPQDKDALALYMQVKDRGAAAAGATSGGSMGSGGGAGGSGGGYAGSGPGPTPGTRGPSVAMSDASVLEAQKQIAQGWSRIKLDPKAALKNFEAAITAAPRSAMVRVQRSKARLETGDAPGALGDSDDAIALDPRLGDGYAARAEAKRALGLKETELLADLETAANLEGRFTEAYKSARLSVYGAAASADGDQGGAGAPEGAPAPAGPVALLTNSPKGWGLLALISVLSAALGGVIVPLVLRRRRSDEGGSPPR
jgi:tetratricopeptide (TPR) repeat protein